MRRLYQYGLIACLSMLGAAQSPAQSSSPSTAPYLLFKVGYGLPDSPQLIGQTATVDATMKTDYFKGVYGSYGKGFNLSAGIGKMLNPTFGLELNAQYTVGSKIVSESSVLATGYSDRVSSHANSLLLKPLIVIRNSGDLLTIYTKLGLAIATVSKVFTQTNLRDPVPNNYLVTEAVEMSKVKVGFAACFGLAFRVTERFSILVEANGQLLSLPLTKGHYTKYEQNSADKLATLTTTKKSWVYVKEGPITTYTIPANEPDRRLFSPTYYSYVGVGAGMMYHF